MRNIYSPDSLGQARLVTHLGPISWLVVLAGATSTVFMPGTTSGGATRLAAMATLVVFFTLITGRLVLAAANDRSRRAPLFFLAAAVALWSIGSASIDPNSMAAFPAPGEVLCLLAYVSLAAFLVLDVRQPTLTAVTSLEAIIVSGTALALAGVVVLAPLTQTFRVGSAPVLLTIMFPLIDVVLGVIVLAQLMMGTRDRSLRTAALGLGVVSLTVADAIYTGTANASASPNNLLLDLIWAFSFAAIVGGALMSPRPSSSRSTVARILVVPLAAAAALGVLILRPNGVIGNAVTVLAIIILAAAGVRLTLALLESEQTAEAERLAMTDDLTGLPSRRGLLAAIDNAVHARSAFGLITLNLDDFKGINDGLGHVAGDEVLIEVAARLRATVHADDVVGRLDGDEFALLLPGQDELSLFETAQRITVALATKVRVQGVNLSVAASMGLTIREREDLTATSVTERAGAAMREAKLTRSGVLAFDASQDVFSRHRLHRGEELLVAVAEGQLVMFYQPQVNARTRAVVGVEALVRWAHPTEGLLQPIEFLSDARRTGMMPAINEAIMRMVLADAKAWADDGFRFRVAMNCAPPELLDGTFLPTLFDALDQVVLPHDTLLIEVTEDSLLSYPGRAREALQALRDHHVQTSIDDYGTGFSSLAYLRDLPVQELKIDRAFITSATGDGADHRSRVIVETTTQMAHALGLRMVAEGVERAESIAELLPLGVDVLQGYQIARPMPAYQVAGWVRAWPTSSKVLWTAGPRSAT